MAGRDKRVYGPALVATGPATIYTVGAGVRSKIKGVWVNNPTALPVTFTMSIGADAAGTRLLETFTIPAKAAGVPNSYLQLWPNIPMEAAEILTVSAGTNNVLTITVTAEESVL